MHSTHTFSKSGFLPLSNQALLLSTTPNLSNSEQYQELIEGDIQWERSSRSLAVDMGTHTPSVELFSVNGEQPVYGISTTVYVGRYRLSLLPTGVLGNNTVTLPVSALLGEQVPHLYLVVTIPNNKKSPIQVISGLCHDQLYRYCRSALSADTNVCTIPLTEFTITPQQVGTYLKYLEPEIIIPF